MTSTKRIFLKVPSLVERPAMGSGCCVVLAEDIVRDELESLDGLWRVRVDDEAGWVEACYDPDRLEAEKIVGALGSVGYPAAYSLRSTAKKSRGFAGRARGAHADGARCPGDDLVEARRRGHATQAPPSDTEKSF